MSFGFHGTTTTGVVIDKRDYKRYVNMRVAVKKYLTKGGHILVHWYEFRIAKDGFHKIQERDYRGLNGNGERFDISAQVSVLLENGGQHD